MIVGTDTYSAPGLVSLMQSWVGSGRASIMVQSSRLHLDPTCGSSLDTLKSPDCEVVPRPPGRTNPTTASPNLEPQAAQKSGGASVGEIGGIAVGAIVAILLVVLIVFIAVIVMMKMKSRLSIK